MNNYLLFCILACFFLLIVWSNKRDLASPSSLFCLGFLTSSLFLMINTEKWCYYISGKTVFFVCASVLVFQMGCSFGKKIRVNTNRCSLSMNWVVNKKLLNVFIVVVIAISFIIRILDVYYATGQLNVFSGALHTYRFNPKETEFASLVSLCDAAMSSIIIFNVTILAEKTVFKRKQRLRNASVVFWGLFYYALSSSRIELIYIFIYYAIAYYFCIKSNNLRVDIKVIKTIVLIIILLYGVFFCAGYLTGKSQMQESVFENISIYTGSSLGALDKWLYETKHTGQYFGSVIFRGINNILSLMGIKTNFVRDPLIRFVNLGNMPHTTNVFSCIAELLSDVGSLGIFIVLFLEGTFSQMIYKKARIMYKKNEKYSMCVYLYLAPILVASSISERFFRVFLTMSTIVFLLILRFLLNSTNKERY